jgi:hypothetical protein
MQPSSYKNNEAITLNELTTAHIKLRNNKTPGEDSVNIQFLNNTWDGGEPPESWQSAQERKYQTL